MTNQLLKPLERWMKLAVIPPAGAGGDPAGPLRSGSGRDTGWAKRTAAGRQNGHDSARASFQATNHPGGIQLLKKTLCELGPFHGAIPLVAGSFPVGTALVGLAGRRCGGLGSHAWSWKRS
jgi:hypothetical protein